MIRRRLSLGLAAVLPLLLAAVPALADDAGPPKLDSGDTAWMLASTALVLMMTIPGLALFYGGMVRKKNILATLAQSFGATALITVLWMVIGYSIAFTTNDSASLQKWIGGFKYFMLKPMTIDAVNPLAGSIPESVYMTFQMTFADPRLFASRSNSAWPAPQNGNSRSGRGTVEYRSAAQLPFRGCRR